MAINSYSGCVSFNMDYRFVVYLGRYLYFVRNRPAPPVWARRKSGQLIPHPVPLTGRDAESSIWPNIWSWPLKMDIGTRGITALKFVSQGFLNMTLESTIAVIL